MKIVTKLGGALLNTAQNIKNYVLKAIEGGSQYIVVSAPGSFEDRIKVTDLLIDFWFNKKSESLNTVLDVFFEISKNLGVDISEILEKSKVDIQNSKEKDFVFAQGERLNAIMICRWLEKEGHNVKFIDSMECIFLKKDGSVNWSKTTKMMQEWCVDSDVYIIPGFYARGYDGKIKTFSRDGSDISGTIVSVSIVAILYNMYKDVPGFCTGDPRYVESTQVLDEISFKDARALTYAGSKIIHRQALIPLAKKGIPVRISNPDNTNSKGTLITKEPKLDSKARPLALAAKDKFSFFHISKMGMNEEVGFVAKILAVFKTMKIPIDQIPTGIDSVSLLVDQENYPTSLKTDIYASNNLIIKHLINKIGKDAKVEVDNNVAVLAVVVTDKVSRFSSQIDEVFDNLNIVPYTGQRLDNQIIVSFHSQYLPKILNHVHNVLFGEIKNSKSQEYVHVIESC